MCVSIKIVDHKHYFKTGPIQTTIKAFKLMNRNKKGRGGVIVNISSIAGLKPFEAKAVYCATKHGLVGFSRSLGVSFELNIF